MITSCLSGPGPPGKPGLPDIFDWDVDRVDLRWTAPKDTGGAPITKYIIEKKERYGAQWETIHESDVSCTLHYLARVLYILLYYIIVILLLYYNIILLFVGNIKIYILKVLWEGCVLLVIAQ